MAYESIYRRELLPSQLYKLSIDFGSATNKIIFVRRSTLSYEDTFDEIGDLLTSAIPKGEIPNMSVNIMGGVFEMEDLKYIQRGIAQKEWNGEDVHIDDLLSDIFSVNEYTPIFINLDDVSGEEIPYSLQKRDVSRDILNKLHYDWTEFGKADPVPLHVFLNFKHVPTYSNYWHAELKVIDLKGDFLSKKQLDGKWGREVLEIIQENIICNVAYSQIDESFDYSIDQSVYINT